MLGFLLKRTGCLVGKCGLAGDFYPGLLESLLDRFHSLVFDGQQIGLLRISPEGKQDLDRNISECLEIGLWGRFG